MKFSGEQCAEGIVTFVHVQGDFTGVYKKTIGVDFMRKDVYLENIGEQVRFWLAITPVPWHV